MVTIRTKTGETWLTHRVKRKTDGRRRRLSEDTVRYIPIKRIPTKGDWLFTCRMEPVQFSHWENDEQLDFVTMDGSHHSQYHCGLHLVSTKYAEFFTAHKLWDLSYLSVTPEEYKERVRTVVSTFKMKFEGV